MKIISYYSRYNDPDRVRVKVTRNGVTILFPTNLKNMSDIQTKRLSTALNKAHMELFKTT